MNLIALIPLILGALSPLQQSTPTLRPSGIAARINGEIITWDEVELRIASVPLQDRTPDLRRNRLRFLAEEELFLQEAKNYAIEVSETDLDAIVEAERKKSDMTPEQFIKWVNREYGYGLSEYRTHLRRQRTIGLLLSRLATEPLRNPNPRLRLLLDFVSPEEMRDYFDRHQEQFRAIRQVDIVFLSLQFQTPEEREEKLRLAASIRRRVREDSPLYIQALAHMDINLMPRKDGRPAPVYQNLAFDEAPFSDEIKKLLYETLKEGDVSDPVVDGNSVSLFHLQRKIVEKDRTFEEAQPFIRRQLEATKRRINQKLLLDDLVRRSFIDPPDLFK
jgi:hypothetical protein